MEQFVIYLPAALAVLALLFMLSKSARVSKQDAGESRMQSISKSSQEGACAFLRAEYRILMICVVIAAIALFVVSTLVETTHWLIVVAFVFGALFSALAGNIGMRIATSANVRTTQASRTCLPQALNYVLY